MNQTPEQKERDWVAGLYLRFKRDPALQRQYSGDFRKYLEAQRAARGNDQSQKTHGSSTESAWAAEYDRSPALQAEFQDYQRYAAFRFADSLGLIRFQK